jgi:hypothetical protein
LRQLFAEDLLRKNSRFQSFAQNARTPKLSEKVTIEGFLLAFFVFLVLYFFAYCFEALPVGLCDLLWAPEEILLLSSWLEYSFLLEV